MKYSATHQISVKPPDYVETVEFENSIEKWAAIDSAMAFYRFYGNTAERKLHQKKLDKNFAYPNASHVFCICVYLVVKILTDNFKQQTSISKDFAKSHVSAGLTENLEVIV